MKKEFITEQLRILELMGSNVLNEQALTGLLDDFLKSGGRTISDDMMSAIKNLGRAGSTRSIRAALVKNADDAVANIGKAYGDDIAREYAKRLRNVPAETMSARSGVLKGVLDDAVSGRLSTTGKQGVKTSASATGKQGAKPKPAVQTVPTRAKGSLAGLSDDIVKRYKEIEQAAKQSGQGFSKGKFNPGQGTRERWIRQAIQETGKRVGTQNVKKLTWANWLFIAGLIGVSGLLLWNVLSTDEENSPTDIPPTPPTDEDTQTTGSEEGTTTIEPWYEGDLCSRTLQRGRIGDDVEELQTKLNNLYNFGLELDGKFGPLTKNAVMEFQRKNQLEVDGIFDENDCEKLNGLSTTTTTSTGTTETITPTVVEPEKLSTEVQDTAIQQELQNKPEEVIAVVAEPQTDQLETDEVAKVEATKKCKEGKTPVLVKFKEKQVNRGGKMINKTVAVYRCKKLNEV